MGCTCIHAPLYPLFQRSINLIMNTIIKLRRHLFVVTLLGFRVFLPSSYFNGTPPGQSSFQK